MDRQLEEEAMAQVEDQDGFWRTVCFKVSHISAFSRSILFCVIAFFYLGFCQLYIFLFVANVSEKDAAKWLESMALRLAQDLENHCVTLILASLSVESRDLPKTEDFIWKPLVLGFILALLASLMLWRNHALLRR